MDPLTDEHPPGPAAEPGPDECVMCFIDRMTRAHGCSNQLTWVGVWGERQDPPERRLQRYFESYGGYCDCEVLANVFWRRELADAQEQQREWTDEDDRRAVKPCAGLHPGSSHPCGHWVRA
jgi:hypothetical protein